MRRRNGARPFGKMRAAHAGMKLAQAALLSALWLGFGEKPVQAQAIVASINGDPVTNIDIDERMKMLRVLHKPAGRDAALESLFTDHLETDEARKFGIIPRDGDITQEITRVAEEMKIAPGVLTEELQHAGVSADHIKAHFGADLAFTVLVGALNKGVEASEEQVRAELAKQGGKAASGTEYTLRQVIFAIPHSASVESLQARGHEAEQLREQFSSCENGVPMARAMTDVTVRDPLVKTGVELSDAVRQLLDKTPTGHLTPPQRSSEGVEMIAVCSKGAAKDDSAARTAIAQKIVAAHVAADAQRRLKELRAKAVIVKY